MQDCITLKDFEAEAINTIIDKAIEIKAEPQKWASSLSGKSLAMIFQKSSTRTRFSFEVGMTQLGGHAIFAQWATTQFGIADVPEEGRSISRYCDLIMARLLRNEDLEALAQGSEVPVINGLTELYHPCQALADLMTVKEKMGRTEGVNVVYTGIANNVSNSLSLCSVQTGANFTLCVPERHPPSLDEELLDILRASGRYAETDDLEAAMENADVVYTDTWIDMEFFTDPAFAEEKQRRIDTFQPYQVNEALVEGRDTLVMHCLPAHKGYEVSETVLGSPNSVVFDQAENRLHSQKALMLWLLGKL